jgi:uncharacterized protein DUF5655
MGHSCRATSHFRNSDSEAALAEWTCPECRRKFARAKQWHSCEVRGVESHFGGKNAGMRKLFDLLIRKLKKSGPLRVDAVKTAINLTSKHHFGGIRVRSDYLRVGFLARKRIDSPRIINTEVLGPNRVAYHVEIRTTRDIDAELLRWLKDAQAMQA